MTGRLTWQWPAAMLAAMALHLAAVLWLASGAGTPPAFRGGGSFDASRERPAADAGLLVALGATRDASPAAAAAAPTPPRAETTDAEEASAAPEPEAAAAIEPVVEETPDVAPEEVAAPKTPLPEAPLPEPAPEPVVETPQPLAAVPLPGRKPKPPPQPELGLLEERLPLQGPGLEQEQEPSTAQSQDQPTSPSEPAGGETAELLHVAGEAGLGTAGENKDGAVPKLNYKDKVLLWLKRHGGYPEGSYRFRQEGVVLLHFAVDRKGTVLYFNIRKSSGYYLLDEAVKTMMRRASPVPPIPAAIAQDKLEFTVPVRFTRS